MKNTLNMIFALAALIFAGCQKNEINPDYSGNYGIVKFTPSISGTGVLTKGQPVSSEFEAALTAEDGFLNIPMTCEATAGISLGTVSSESVATKGELINENGPGAIAFATDKSFYVKAWDASTSANIIPGTAAGSYQQVTYSDSQWGTSPRYLWNNGETKTFYAYANLPSSGASIANADATGQTLTYDVPSTASAQTDILMGYYSGDGSTGDPAVMTGTASILFSHPLTAVKFKLGTIEGVTSFVINSITIEKVYAGGTAEMTPTTAAETDPKDRFNWAPTGTVAVSQSISTQPTASAPAIGEAFLLIPQTFSESSTARIVVNVTMNGTETVTLYHYLTSGEWKAGYTNTYTIGYDSHTYTYSFTLSGGSTSGAKSFTNTTASATSSLTIISKRTDENGVVTDAEWEIKSVKVGTAAAETIDHTSFTDMGGLDAACNTSLLSITAAARTNMNPSSKAFWQNTSGRTKYLEWSPDDWSTRGTIDLSKYNFRTESTDSPMNTANCYIIRHAGTYKLPLVYGNGIVNGAINEQSFFPNVTGGSNRLVRFQNHIQHDDLATNPDKGIRSPFIENNTTDGLAKSEDNDFLSVLSADIVWQDRAEVVTNLKIVDADGHEIGSDDYQSRTDGSYSSADVHYLQFDIDQSAICQNNALIAVKGRDVTDVDGDGDTDEDVIMWSWHIWTTNNPALLAEPITVTNYTDNKYDFFPIYNLGWIDATNYLARENVNIVLAQKKSGKEIEIMVKQLAVIGKSNGCWYQFGRKDPMCPTDTPAYPAGWSISEHCIYSQTTLANSIRIPDMIYYHRGNNPLWCSTTYFNLWTGKKSTSGIYGQDKNMIKTIYDPSPTGYKMPASDAFTGFSKTGGDVSSPSTIEMNIDGSFCNGWYFYTKKASEKTESTPTIFFSASGNRRQNSGEIVDVGNTLRYSSAVYAYSMQYSWNNNNYILYTAGSGGTTPGYSVRPVIDTTMPNNPME